jgi:3-hydroxyisobutyrate dehydrogenase-like beta-hydroxyacid dehydrogenase
MIKKISYLGLGTMDSGMASNLLKAGYQLTVWDRTAAKCEPFARKGARGNENASALIKALEKEAGVEVDGGRTTI